jgi:hypothetical protein
MGYVFKLLRSGTVKPAGVVDVPFLGAKVGEFRDWTLTRRGDSGQDAGLYDLRAAFSFVSEALWEDPEYVKRVIVSLTPNKQYRLTQAPGYATVRQGQSLLMEGVTLDAV